MNVCFFCFVLFAVAASKGKIFSLIGFICEGQMCSSSCSITTKKCDQKNNRYIYSKLRKRLL